MIRCRQWPTNSAKWPTNSAQRLLHENYSMSKFRQEAPGKSHHAWDFVNLMSDGSVITDFANISDFS